MFYRQSMESLVRISWEKSSQNIDSSPQFWGNYHEILTVHLLYNWVKGQFRGPELYKKKGAQFQEESYLPRIFRSSSLNLHTSHLIHIVFWWQIFFREHGKSTTNDRQDHHVLVINIVIMTSQSRCTRALSQSHVAKHDNHVPVAPLIGSGLGVMSMQWLLYGKINFKSYGQKH